MENKKEIKQETVETLKDKRDLWVALSKMQVWEEFRAILVADRNACAIALRKPLVGIDSAFPAEFAKGQLVMVEKAIAMPELQIAMLNEEITLREKELDRHED